MIPLEDKGVMTPSSEEKAAIALFADVDNDLIQGGSEGDRILGGIGDNAIALSAPAKLFVQCQQIAIA